MGPIGASTTDRDTTAMPSYLPKSANEVEQLLLNARLREEMEPFRDESVDRMDPHHLTTRAENEFLKLMLDWEYAPVLPIGHWFSPPLELPNPAQLDDRQIHQQLWYAIHRLYEQAIVLAYTDHLSDRQLYSILLRDILPAAEKKMQRRAGHLFWCFIDPEEDEEIWLRYYASDAQRARWAAETGQRIPDRQSLPQPRSLPGPPPPA